MILDNPKHLMMFCSAAILDFLGENIHKVLEIQNQCVCNCILIQGDAQEAV